MQSESDKGNYCICGADFNKQLADNPENYYPKEKVYVMKKFPLEFLDGTNIKVVSPFNPNNPIGSCRSAGQVWSEKDPVCNIDGFLVSSNVQVLTSDVIDANFQYSDHNPVYMTFRLV